MLFTQHSPWLKQAPSIYQALVLKRANDMRSGTFSIAILYDVFSKKHNKEAVPMDITAKHSQTYGCSVWKGIAICGF